MNANDLPPKAGEIFKKIRKKHKVAFETLKLNDKEIKLLQVTDLESLLAGKDPFNDVSEFPLWVKLWEASLILSHVVAALPPGSGATFLELGAGLGASGLTAAACGYNVTLSDYGKHILDFQKVSAAANGFDNVNFEIIDWKKPPDLPKYDVIAGAEILFNEDFFEPLLNVFNKLLAQDGTIYLAHDARRKSLPDFLNKAAKNYDIAVSSRTLTSDGEKRTVIVNRLRPKRKLVE